MLDKTIARRALNLLLSLCLIFSLVPVSIGYPAPAVSPQPRLVAPASAAVPSPLSQSLSIARVQSQYTAGTLDVIFTVSNNLPVTRLPDIPTGATDEQIADIFAAFVPLLDANTLRSSIVTDTLAAGVTLISTSGNVTQNGSTLTWQLPDLAPQSSAQITLTIQTPSAGGDFINLDTGAQASALRWGQAISANARSAVIVPTGIDSALLATTSAADPYDPELIWYTSGFEQDPLAAFAAVQSFRTDLYQGALRGTRGTLWGEAGNSLDKASALIAMLRAAGVPARYRHGTLNNAQAQTLIASLFPAANGVAGYVPIGTQLADPVNDASLIALASDHWWVEAYLPGSGWTDLDPTFPQATVGQAIATPSNDGTDRAADVPAGVHHTLRVRLKREQYSSFPVGGTTLSTSYPLDEVFNVSQLAGKRVTLGHLVHEVIQGGVFSSVTRDYTPYLMIEDNGLAYEGATFQDLLTNFPLATTFTTAEWLEYEIHSPDGHTETFTREVKDLIGAATRRLGGSPQLAVGTSSGPFFGAEDVYVNWVLPNAVSDWAAQRQSVGVLARLRETGALSQTMLEIANAYLPGEFLNSEDEAAYRAARADLVFVSEFALSSIGLNFARQADAALTNIEDGLRTRLYYTTPRVFTVSSIGSPATTVTTTVDLRHTSVEAIVHPGQAAAAKQVAQWIKGLNESVLEGEALAQGTSAVPLTTMRVFDEMTAQGIDPVMIQPNEYGLLDAYPFSDDALAHVIDALLEGRQVLIPSRAVLIDGEPTFAWWEIDPVTGETISVGENGLHPSALEYRLMQIIVEEFVDNIAGAGAPFSPADPVELAESALQIGLTLRGYFFAAAAGIGGGNRPQTTDTDFRSFGNFGSLTNGSAWRSLPAYLCPPIACGVEQFFMNDVNAGLLPLPELAFVYGAASGNDVAITTMTASAPGSGTPAFTLTANPSASSIAPGSPSTFQAQITSNFADDFTLAVYAPIGWAAILTATGQISIQPADGVAPGSYVIQLVAQSKLHPELIQTATHTITIQNSTSAQLSISPEPKITVAMGLAAISGDPNETNDGEVEVPGAAYTLVLTNTSGSARTFDVNVNGPPADWLILNAARSTSATIALAAGEAATLGLYISPSSGTLPPVNTNYPINVTAVSAPINVQASSVFNMPPQPFNYMTLNPTNLYLPPNSSTPVDLNLTNVGNAAGSFDLSAHALPISATVNGLPASQSLAQGASASLPLTLTIGDATPGATFLLVIAGKATNSTTQYATANARVAGPYSGGVFQAADQLAFCPLSEPNLSATLATLAIAMANLEQACAAGTCDLNQRDQAVRAAQQAANYAGSFSALVTADDALLQAANSLATHSNPIDVETDLAAIRDAVAPLLADQMCALSEHMPSLRWSTGYSAALIGQSRDTVLELKNLGTLTTTYAVTITLPNGSQIFNVLLNPGATVTTTYALSNSVTGLVSAIAQATAVGPEIGLSGLSASAATRLNVVDRFVQLTAVNPDPAYVETGVSSSNIVIEVNNLANLPIDTTALITFTSPSGSTVYSSTQPLRVLGATQTYDLGAINTSGWAIGVYTVTVDLRCANDLCDAPNAVPDGLGYGFLTVGQGLQIEHAVSPETVTEGTFTVTTIITSALTAPAIQPPAALRPSLPSPDIISSMSGEGPGVRLPAPNAPTTVWAITRTENTSPAIVVSGTWTVITHTRVSQNNFSRSSTVSNTATFTFTGPWINLGFATASDGGQADVLIDGVNAGLVDTYSRDPEVASFIFDNLGAGSHTVTIRVRGTRHPNSSANGIGLDYIDVWDGTDMPIGRVEQDSPRVWRSGGWTDTTNAAASGGSYMGDAAGSDATAWFPFTGDSISFVGFTGSLHRLGISIDGEWRGYFNQYAGTEGQRVMSFDNLGPGAHIMQIRHYSGAVRVDAFETPGFGPFYEPPTPIGFTRYEEYHPALSYNGYDYFHRPQGWNENLIVPIMSDAGLVSSNVASNTVSLTFEGVWASIGYRTWSDGGRAEVLVDGVSVGTIGMYSTTNELKSFAIGNLITGTHTLEIVVLNQPDPPGTGRVIYFDYIDVWDGSPLPDGFINAQRRSADGRLRFNASGTDAFSANAIDGDYFTSGLPNSFASVWYPFIGNSFTLYGFSRNNTTSARVYVDNLLIDTVSFSYPYSEQPIAKQYAGFGDGPHVVRVLNQATMRIDGFASLTTTAQIQPLLEWAESDRTAGASIWGGLHVPTAVADLNNDGLPEIVVASSNIDSNGELFVLRGDGQDAGGGSPIIWSHPYNIFNGFEDVGAPAIAELDGQPGAEIVHPTAIGLYAYHADGSVYWYTDTVQSHAFFASPAIGNLDADPEPEIVVNMNHDLLVFKQDGALTWRKTYTTAVSMPVLADLTGDGVLDILAYGSGNNVVELYSYNFGSPALVWTATVTTPLSIYGSPAVADIDRHLPDGDTGPEVAISSNGMLHVLNGEDGSHVWATALDPGSSAGVSIADLDGDGEIEIVTGMLYNGGRIYAVNADGSIAWSAPALDNSPLNASVMDIDGDGAYEVAFNGATQGLTIYDGHNGDVLFNEPSLSVVSKTGSDYPLFADVDNDGFGELVVTSQAGLRVFGFDQVWAEARPLWNQLTYHINNIRDDLSVPFTEWNSWAAHNTYRTQSPSRYPMPNYAIDLTHTVGLNNVIVLTNTFSITPDRSAPPDYGWSYQQDGAAPIVTRTFQSRLINLQTGESRMVAQGTQVSYTLASGSNQITLPPLYVTVQPIATLTPAAQDVASGETAVFTLTVRNPSSTGQVYTLDLAGLPATWFTLPPTMTVPANGSTSLVFAVNIPIGSGPGQWSFSITATAGSSVGQAGGEINVAAPTLTATIAPTEQTAPVGVWTIYTLTLSNTDSAQHVYSLSGSGLAEVNVPNQITVAANSTRSITFTARTGNEGPHPLAVEAERTDTGERAEPNAILIGAAQSFVALSLDPSPVSVGPGGTAIVTVTLNNLGVQLTALDLDVLPPTGWTGDLTLYGQPVDQVTLAPAGLSTLNVQLALQVPSAATAGVITYTVRATSQGDGAQFAAIGTVQVLNRGVQLDIVSGPASILPGANGTWQVTVKNVGAQADTFDLSAFGPLSLGGSITPNSVTLSPGAAQNVQLQVTASSEAQAGAMLLGALAQSRSDAAVRDEDALDVQIAIVRAAAAQWQPTSLNIVSGTTGLANLSIENTGNTETTFDVSLNNLAHVTALLPFTQIVLPPNGQVTLPIEVAGDVTGSYQLIATVTGGAAPVQATLTVNVNGGARRLYLPLMLKQAPQADRHIYLSVIMR